MERAPFHACSIPSATRPHASAPPQVAALERELGHPASRQPRAPPSYERAWPHFSRASAHSGTHTASSMQPSLHEFRPKPRTALAHQPAVNERFRPARQHGRTRGCADERLVPVDGVGAQEAHRIADKCVKRREWSSKTTAACGCSGCGRSCACVRRSPLARVRW